MTRPVRLLVVATALATLALVAASMGWRLVHDTALMQYVAWRMTEGATLYRDLYDLDLPGVFLLHGLLLKTLGGSDLAWRVYDLLFLAAGAGLIVAFGRRMGDGWSATAAALLFCLYHLAGGASDMGQRDFMMVPFLLAGAYGVAVFRVAPDRLWPLVWGGLAVGMTLTLKPFAVLMVGALGLAAATARAPRLGAMLRDGLVFGFAAALPNLLIYGWLAAQGTLGILLSGLFGFVRTNYGAQGAASLFELAQVVLGPYAGPVGRTAVRLGLSEGLGWVLVLGVLAATAAAVAWSLRGRSGPWRWLALVGVGYGVVHLVWQNKGFGYHCYPLVAFACLAASAMLATSKRKQLALGMALYVVLAGFLGAKAAIGPDRPWIAAKLAVVDGLSADLRPLVGAGDRVQVMDMTGGGIHALYQLHAAQPTKYIYDFPFYYPLDDGIRAMRTDYMAELNRQVPRALVLFKDDGLRHTYARLAEFPELERLVATRYRIAVERPDYRVYTLR